MVSDENYAYLVMNVCILQAGQAATVSLTTTQIVIILIASQLFLTTSVHGWFTMRDDAAPIQFDQEEPWWLSFFHTIVPILYMISLAICVSRRRGP